MDLFSLTNLIKSPTNVTPHGASLIDVALTTNRYLFTDHLVTDVGCSDGHSMIVVTSKRTVSNPPAKVIQFRSYKTFNDTSYCKDMAFIPFSVCESFDDPGDSLWAMQHLIGQVLNDHAPLKTKKIRARQPPFMNNNLRKNILKKNNLRRKFLRSRSKRDWESFRSQRNKTTSIRRQSIKNYFLERCKDGHSNKDFYKTIKPFLSSRFKTDNNLMIDNGGKILTNPKDVANCMNDYYIQIANEIGSDNNIPVITDFSSTTEFVTASKDYFTNHPSITNIKDNCVTSNFTLKHIDDATTKKIILKIFKPEKSHGY